MFPYGQKQSIPFLTAMARHLKLLILD